MNGFTLHELAEALGGEIVCGEVLAPGPGHSRKDRSLSVRLAPKSPNDFVVTSFAGDDWRDCRDYVRAALGRRHRIEKPSARARPAVPPASSPSPTPIWPGLWRRAVDPRGTLVERYLREHRYGIAIPKEAAGEAIRFDPRCQFGAGAAAAYFPAIVCLIRNIANNQAQGIQKTALHPDGTKVERNGKTLRMCLGAVKGGSIKVDLDEHVDRGVCIGEGLETTLAGRQLGFRPAWAVISAAGIADFPILPGLDGLTIFAENDPASRDAVQKCFDRWTDARLNVEIRQSKIGSDLNDAIRERT